MTDEGERRKSSLYRDIAAELQKQIRLGAYPVGKLLPTETELMARYAASRHKMVRRACSVQTPWGPVCGKLRWLVGRPPVFSPEYESCAHVARTYGVPLREVYLQAQQAYAEKGACG